MGTLEITPNTQSILESVIAHGDLGKLSVGQRNEYYLRVCESVGLNPLTRPFEYITLNGKLTLYARKDATDQLRMKRGVSIAKPDIRLDDPDYIVVTVEARDRDGRTDSDVGVVSRKDMRGDFGNALMKAVTKAKRRVTLSICGLGMLDETEVETIPDAKAFVESAAVQQAAPTPKVIDAPKKDALPVVDAEPLPTAIEAARIELRALGMRGKNVIQTLEGEKKTTLDNAMALARLNLNSDNYPSITAAIGAMKRALDM